MKIVALLPIKYNSERVPGKNFKPLGNKPLYRWILDTLLTINKINYIIINTDAVDLLNDKNLNSNSKIILRERKKELCGDFVSMNKIIEDDINSIDADIYLMTHTTNPFLKTDTIINAIDKLQLGLINKEHDSLFTVNKFYSRFYCKDAKPLNHDPKILIRTQDLEPLYEENSNLYLFTKESFNKNNARIGNNPILLENNKLESIDIDTQEDWDFASIISNHFIK